MHVPALILGAGAAGLMAAAHTPPGTLIVDHAKAPGEKIRISGGGRCNFTNLNVEPAAFLGANPHFHKSALARYTQWDFIALVEAHGISWHEKTLGQLFCDRTAKDIVAMLVAEAGRAGATLRLRTEVTAIARDGARFRATLETEGRRRTVTADALVLATGGKSIPKMGATGLAYRLAEQFGHEVTETRPALVPFTLGDDHADLKGLSGVSVEARACADTGPAFDEALLFTHRGLSGPAALQVSSFWRDGEAVTLDLCPGTDMAAALIRAKKTSGRRTLPAVLTEHLPDRLAEVAAARLPLPGPLAEASDARLAEIGGALNAFILRPTATEGYRTAEVTLGGIATEGVSSKTMESKTVPGLYMIGEAMDVTGWLGGYNFQWAWSSGWAAGTAIAQRMASP